MSIVLKSEEQAKEYFVKAMHTGDVNEIIVFHNQRNTLGKVIKEAAAETSRFFVEKDLTTVSENEMGAMKLESSVPVWLKYAMEAEEGSVIFLKEFHEASDKIKADVLNIMIKKEIEGISFSPKTLIVLGVQEDDDAAHAVRHAHTAEFYREK